MKYLYLCILVFIFSMDLYSQKEYSHWILGAGACYQGGYNGTTDVVFTDAGVSMFPSCRDTVQFYDTNASICDSEGNLLFYTNGSHIYDRYDHIMLNGDSINYGFIWTNWGEGYPVPMGAMIIPKPNNDSLYFVFTLLGEPLLNPNYYEPCTKLSYSIVNRYLNNGLGVVTQKEIPIIQDTLSSGMVTACRHANGRDWWIVIPESASNCIYTCLLSPQGMGTVQKQCLGFTYFYSDWNGQACFSPDGNWYARHTPWDDLHLYRFDRCTGQFFNPIDIYINGSGDGVGAGGVAFSPNSRYLYLTKGDALYQYDMEVDDIAASKIVVDTSDYFQDPNLPLTFNFYSMRLAPDNKIYMSSANSNLRYGLINNPNEAGTACNFQEHLPFPTNIAAGLPNFPYNGLKAELGSACDTLGVAWGEVSVSGLQFGGVHLGDSLSLTAKLRSTGTGTLHLAPDIGVGSSFSISPSSIYIGAGDSLEVAVKFKPAAVGAYSELLPLLSNIPGGITLQLPVTGVGLPPNGVASPSTSEGGGIRLFPNPNDGNFLIQWDEPLAEGQTATVTITDLLGKVITQSLLSEGNTYYVFQPSTPLANGFYFCRVSIEGGETYVSKVIISH